MTTGKHVTSASAGSPTRAAGTGPEHPPLSDTHRATENPLATNTPGVGAGARPARGHNTGEIWAEVHRCGKRSNRDLGATEHGHVHWTWGGASRPERHTSSQALVRGLKLTDADRSFSLQLSANAPYPRRASSARRADRSSMRSLMRIRVLGGPSIRKDRRIEDRNGHGMRGRSRSHTTRTHDKRGCGAFGLRAAGDSLARRSFAGSGKVLAECPVPGGRGPVQPS